MQMTVLPFLLFCLLQIRTHGAWLSGQDPALLFDEVAAGLRQDPLVVDLALPKFESRYEDSLINGVIPDWGWALPSSRTRLIYQMINSHEKILYIGEVKHKSFVRVDEKGTEAAAATSVEMRVTSIPYSEHQIVFDRPFVYGIMDLATGLPCLPVSWRSPNLRHKPALFRCQLHLASSRFCLASSRFHPASMDDGLRAAGCIPRMQ